MEGVVKEEVVWEVAAREVAAREEVVTAVEEREVGVTAQ